MFDYLKQSFARKKARRIFSKYPCDITSFQLANEGSVQFANWKNLLIEPKVITQSEVNFVRQFAPMNSFCIKSTTIQWVDCKLIRNKRASFNATPPHRNYTCQRFFKYSFDKDVIRSITALIGRYKPVLIAECFDKATLDEREELYNIVADQGYDLYYFADFDEKAEVIKLSVSDMNRWKNFNFYAIPR